MTALIKMGQTNSTTLSFMRCSNEYTVPFNVCGTDQGNNKSKQFQKNDIWPLSVLLAHVFISLESYYSW